MKFPEVVVVDYGAGNLLSVRRGLEYCGARVVFSREPKQIRNASRIVLPGVGAFKRGMQELDQLQLIEPLLEVAKRGTPFLGICLGMQMLMEKSEEFGISDGLGLIPGKVIAVPRKNLSGVLQKIPHIGWNELLSEEQYPNWSHTLLEDTQTGEAMYFTHSFMANVENPKHQLAHCLYGGHHISAVVRRDNMTGCQFHPEKSGEAGLKILKKFICD